MAISLPDFPRNHTNGAIAFVKGSQQRGPVMMDDGKMVYCAVCNAKLLKAIRGDLKMLEGLRNG